MVSTGWLKGILACRGLPNGHVKNRLNTNCKK